VGNASDPRVVVDALGNGFAVWHQHDGVRYSIWSSRYRPGTGWQTHPIESGSGPGTSSGAQIEMDASGNAIVVWHQFDGVRNGIWSNDYVSGAGWGTAQRIESGAGNESDPQIVVDARGNASVLWEQHDGVRYGIWSNRFVADSGWGTAQRIETASIEAINPQAATDANGDVVVVWEGLSATGYRDIRSNRLE
jgi:hypothetical protein